MMNKIIKNENIGYICQSKMGNMIQLTVTSSDLLQRIEKVVKESSDLQQEICKEIEKANKRDIINNIELGNSQFYRKWQQQRFSMKELKQIVFELSRQGIL